MQNPLHDKQDPAEDENAGPLALKLRLSRWRQQSVTPRAEPRERGVQCGVTTQAAHP